MNPGGAAEIPEQDSPPAGGERSRPEKDPTFSDTGGTDDYPDLPEILRRPRVNRPPLTPSAEAPHATGPP